MRKKPVKVSLIAKESDNTYRIRFQNLKIPVTVNEDLFQKMIHSNQYQFANLSQPKIGKHSA